MAAQTETPRPARPKRGDYLPVLTCALLLVLAASGAIWFFFYRPTTQEDKEVEAFRQALRYIPANYVGTADETELFHAAMRGMVASLNDKYSAYITPEERSRIDEQTEGRFVGIGITISVAGGLPVVVQVHKGGPAEEAGIEPGDLIAYVGDEPIEKMPLDEVVNGIRGAEGTDVSLRLRRPATAEEISVTVTRRKLTIPNVGWQMRDDGIGVIGMSSFDRNGTREVKQALEDLAEQGMKALILDLRGNLGGLLQQAQETCDLFLKGALIVNVRGRGGVLVESLRADDNLAIDPSVPVVVLVDGNTASAAEIVSGALQADGRATVIGTTTVGKGSVTNIRGLEDESGLILTVARYELAGGRIVEGKGIQPDIVVGALPPSSKTDSPEEVKAWREQYLAAREEQLKAAVDFLTRKLSGG